MNIQAIRWRLLASTLGLIIALFAALTCVQFFSLRGILKKEVDQNDKLIQEKIFLRGQIVSDKLAQKIAIEMANLSKVKKLINVAVKENSGLTYGILMSADNLALVHTLQPELEQAKRLSTPEDFFAVTQKQATQQTIIRNGEKFVEFIVPIESHSKYWNVLRLGFSMKQIAANIAHQDIDDYIWKMVINSLIITVIFLLISFFIVFLISTKISKLIQALTESANQLGSGNFSVKIPVRIGYQDEVSVLATTFAHMAKKLEQSHKQHEEKIVRLEQRVVELSLELRKAVEKITESIEYGKLIQFSLLPNKEVVKTYMPNNFIIWEPKEIIGGDMIYTEFFEDGFIVAIMDCTGHGVPGAFMTLVATTILRKIIRDEACHVPWDILKRLNFRLKTSLQQDSNHAQFDNGLDAAICWVNPSEKILTFAGAKLPLYYIHNEQMIIIPGDKQSLGYKRADLDFTFSTHTVKIEEGMSFYMSTDGLLDQPGGSEHFPFGTKRFRNVLMENHRYSFSEQSERLLKIFNEYRGESERLDDVTVVGFGYKKSVYTKRIPKTAKEFVIVQKTEKFD